MSEASSPDFVPQNQYYVFLDSENNPVIRLKSYIDNHNPNFWGSVPDSAHVWTVDASDDESVLGLLQGMARKQLPSETVRIIAMSIGVDLEAFIAKMKKRSQKPKQTNA